MEMNNSDNKDSLQCVRVAVNIRPLVTSELLVGCTDCISVFPAESQVQIGSHSFTFDYIFGNGGYPCSRIFDECVAPLVDALFHGYNGTVLAYGQTGSGKTYTMGTNYGGEEHQNGVIPKVMDTIFSKVEAMKESAEFLIRVSFIEIFKEEVYDLLDPNIPSMSRSDLQPKSTGLARVPIQIRETVSGGITLAGVKEAEVKTKDEMASYLLQGSVSRATASTNMNSQSSRSHAIFTISMEQKRTTSSSVGDDVGDDILTAKLHLVDLAGSERAKRTGADGTRLREGIHINKGLLALGNVISALGDDKKRKEGGHVPYRDSKLTRLLQDSLGGNSKTVMIACVSPADVNAEETLNTLKYANRARNIQNKAIVNRDPMATQVQRMRSQIEQLQAELLCFRGDSTSPVEELQMLKHKISLLEASNDELRKELQECRINNEQLKQRTFDAQVERDGLLFKIESSQNGKNWNEIDSNSEKDFNLVKTYVSKIQDLEGEVQRLQNLDRSRCKDYASDYVGLEDDGLHSGNSYIMDSDIKNVETNVEAEDVEKELEHSSLQEKLDKELQELDKRLEQKEAEMKRFASADTSVLKLHYEKKVQDLELEKRGLQKEIEELRHNLANISSNSDDSAQKLKEEYLQKLNVLETQVAVLKKKQDAQAQLLRQKQKSDENAKRLQEEIHRIKTQKVQLQQKIKQESEQFRLWKASREKEVLQLKKEGRRNEYEMHKLLALNQRQKMVLQRKTEEASMATKRLKELLESRKASREIFGGGNKNGPGIQALLQAIEDELEVTVRVHEVRSEYEHQKEERTKMAKELAELKDEAQRQKQYLSQGPQTMSPCARNSRIVALENMVATASSTLISMSSQLSEAEERERAFNGRGRWNHVRSLAEAKNIMNFLFNLTSSSRCQLRDREVNCREKDCEIRDLKEKIVNLVRQLEMQKAELSRQEKLMKLASKRQSREMTKSFETHMLNNSEGHAYDLRPKGSRNSIVFNGGRYNCELLEDMDTSDDDLQPEDSDIRSDDDAEWVRTKEKKMRQDRKKQFKIDNHLELESNVKGQDLMTSKDGVCCSCSKYSSCKTMRCECRAAEGSCGSSCSCEPTKCSNTEEASRKVSVQPEFVEAFENLSMATENEKSHVLAAEGAKLLQSALSEKPVITSDGGTGRKPLSDIGNDLTKSNAPKPKKRKNWRKSVIQLVPAIPPTLEAQGPVKSESNVEADIPLKLPRAMRFASVNNNPLKERNLDQPIESVVDKDTTSTSTAPVSPHQQTRTTNGKENQGQ
ncbi:kinesin-like protein KIN-4C isoform X1 [Olea europaea var. sylvestris]|uniref:kinesin-like protein KIN-4C isoform X1 n=1 Tax=Olea europaea var. sylvestris TaxID=158386 RepID=UPI000C1D402B|nr:kinesin-like protein KIN-4C isoform X1 [Olea europaea var. sylvestris]XP_022849583.1 kinesin-like protein KIN-4C isoform X1 [Olea europaea var. sylvestris]